MSEEYTGKHCDLLVAGHSVLEIWPRFWRQDVDTMKQCNVAFNALWGADRCIIAVRILADHAECEVAIPADNSLDLGELQKRLNDLVDEALRKLDSKLDTSEGDGHDKKQVEK